MKSPTFSFKSWLATAEVGLAEEIVLLLLGRVEELSKFKKASETRLSTVEMLRRFLKQWRGVCTPSWAVLDGSITTCDEPLCIRVLLRAWNMFYRSCIITQLHGDKLKQKIFSGLMPFFGSFSFLQRPGCGRGNLQCKKVLALLEVVEVRPI